MFLAQIRGLHLRVSANLSWRAARNHLAIDHHGQVIGQRKHHAMLLVEHDMDAVFALADHLTVMVNGQVIASGPPAQIRADAKVQAAYLGEEH